MLGLPRVRKHMAALCLPASRRGVFPNHVSAAPQIPFLLLKSRVTSHIENLGQFDPLLLKGVCCTPEVHRQVKRHRTD